MKKAPLAGIRIVDLGQGIANPMGSRELGLLGAEVIHIESTKRTDVTRYGTPADNQPDIGEIWNKSWRYNTVNTNKKSLTLDLSTSRGRELLKKLVTISDVVMENWTPRVKRNLGLSYEELKKIKPDIILISASGYGEDGPWSNWAAWGMAVDPMCGLTNLTGFPDGRPVKGSPPMCDCIASSYVVLAVVSSLEFRRRAGKGQWVQISEMETGVCHMGPAIMDYTMNGRVRSRIGNSHASLVPHGCYRCKGEDNWITIAATSDDEWKSLCTIMGRPELVDDARFTVGSSRYENQEELDRIIEKWTVNQDHYELMERLQKAGIPAGAVLNMKELLLDQHLKERDGFEAVVHPDYEGTRGLGTRLYPSLSWKLSKSTLPGVQPAPRLGEHNNYVLKDLLGLVDDEVNALEAEGIIGTVPLSASQPGIHQSPPISEMLELGEMRGYDPNYREILDIPGEENR